VIERFLHFVVNLRRVPRILIVLFFSGIAVAAVFPLIDHIYLRFFFTTDSTIAPSLVSVTIGGLMYIVGWFLYVGTIGTTPSARNAILWYFVIGSVLTILVFGMLIYGVFDLNIPVDTA